MRRWNKKGDESMLAFLIFELIALGVIFMIVFITVKDVVNDNTYWKRYYSIDLALVADIENINQGDFVINYELMSYRNAILKGLIVKDNTLELVLKQDSIEVYDIEDKNRIPRIFPYAKNKNIQAIESSMVSDFVVLTKKGSQLMLGTYDASSQDFCISTSTTMDMDHALLTVQNIDPKTKGMADTVAALLSQHGKGKSGDTSKVRKEFNIIFYYQQSDGGIYYSNDQTTIRSQKLACLIRNKLSEKNIDMQIKPYNGLLDNVDLYKNYLATRESGQAWLIIVMDDASLKFVTNDFAIAIENAFEEYYN